MISCALAVVCGVVALGHHFWVLVAVLVEVPIGANCRKIFAFDGRCDKSGTV